MIDGEHGANLEGGVPKRDINLKSSYNTNRPALMAMSSVAASAGISYTSFNSS